MIDTLLPAPVQARERIPTLDIIRGVAVCGILLMNITAFGMPVRAYADPTVYGGAEGANLWAWIINAMLFEGTQRGLFTLLFGAGVVLFTERMEASQRSDAIDLYFRRNLWLVVFGVVHGFLLWFGEILFAYGIIALFVYAFRKAKPATLLLVALGGLAFNAAWYQLDVYNAIKVHERMQEALVAQQHNEQLTSRQREAIEAWNVVVKEMKPDGTAIREVVDASRGPYFRQVLFQAPIRNEMQIHLVYRLFFDMFSMMLIGMALFKWGVLSLGLPRRIYVYMVLIGYGIGLSVNFFEVRHLVKGNFSVLAFLQSDVTYDAGRLAMTTGHVGMLMLFCGAPVFGGLKRRLSAVGQMAFTNYVSQSVICATIFFGFGFSLFGQFQRYELYYVVLGVWVTQLIVSPIWLTHYQYGPLEWLWRTLTYGKLQRMRRSTSVGATIEQSS